MLPTQYQLSIYMDKMRFLQSIIMRNDCLYETFNAQNKSIRIIWCSMLIVVKKEHGQIRRVEKKCNWEFLLSRSENCSTRTKQILCMTYTYTSPENQMVDLVAHIGNRSSPVHTPANATSAHYDITASCCDLVSCNNAMHFVSRSIACHITTSMSITSCIHGTDANAELHVFHDGSEMQNSSF
jgi:hypothetical protein